MEPPLQTAAPLDAPPTAEAGFFHRYVVKPLVDLLRVGATPQKLAWSITVGVVIGINPLLGSTTLVSLLATAVLRLNFVASQLATHLCYPLEIALFFLFIRVGDKVFHTKHMPLHREALLSAVRHHPIQTTKLLWTWEWHALVIWALASVVIAPLMVLLLTPVLVGLNERIHRPAAAA